MNKDKSKEVKECEEQYQKDIDLCEKELQAQKIIIYAAVAALAAKTIEGGAAVSAGGAAATGGPGGIAGIIGTGGVLAAEGIGTLGAIALAEVNCESCKNQAEKDYKDCLKKIKDE